LPEEKDTQMAFDPSSLSYNDAGLVPAIAQDAQTGAVLMLAWMSAEAVSRTLETGNVTYWSRSRQEFWVKGETSGNRQKLLEMRVDCDRDALLLLVDQTGPACHTGRISCFYSSVEDGELVEVGER
jgi:phosphoribosyl-AMP cyclohydrolase